MKWTVPIAFLAISVAAPAAASGPFDGNWTGQTPSVGACGVWEFHLTVASADVTGYVIGQTARTPKSTGIVQNGNVASDGNSQIVWTLGDRFQGAFRFNANSLTGKFTGPCGEAQVTGARTRR